MWKPAFLNGLLSHKTQYISEKIKFFEAWLCVLFLPKESWIFLSLYKYDIKAINLVAYTIHSKAWYTATFSTVGYIISQQKIILIVFFLMLFLTSASLIEVELIYTPEGFWSYKSWTNNSLR